MQIYRIREGKFYVPFLLENIYEYLFDEKTCLLLNRNKVMSQYDLARNMSYFVSYMNSIVS